MGAAVRGAGPESRWSPWRRSLRQREAPIPCARTYILLDSTTPDALGRLQRLDKLLDALTHEDGWSAPTSVRGRHYQTVEHVREE